MELLDRYILRQIGLVTLVTAVVLTFSVWMTQSLRLFDLIVNRGLPATKFLQLAGLLLPSFLGVVLPISAFVATLFVYNRLAADSELFVLRAAGTDQLRLSRPALLLGLIIMLACYAISLVFLPLSYRSFKDLQNEIRHDYSSVLLREGVFTEIDDGITVFVRERNAAGALLGILVHDGRDPEKPVTIMAERGAIVRGDDAPLVVVADGSRQEYDRRSRRLSILNFDRYTIALGGGKEAAAARWRQPNERFLGELFAPPQSEEDRRFRPQLIAEAHQRLVGPLYVMAFVAIGLAAQLTGEFNRRRRATRVIVAVVAVALLEGLQLALQDLATRSAFAIPAMYLVVILSMAAAFYLLFVGLPRRRPENGIAPEPA